jgi:uncharacterized protein (TIGR02646 family)
MIRVPELPLPGRAAKWLERWQKEIDGLSGYAQQVEAAKKRFRQRNQKRNRTFAAVRRTLTRMCSGARRCMYCEDSVADEVEHIKPKDLYPDAVFVWENYLYACGPCNGPKNNQFAVFAHGTGNFTVVSRPAGAPVVPPVASSPVLIDPRREDPFRLLWLDVLGTFEIRPIPTLPPKEYRRAEYTVELLGLNDREYLVVARAGAYQAFRALLKQYIDDRSAGRAAQELQKTIDAVRSHPHATVWAYMKRIRAGIAELDDLFARAPEALKW